MRHVVFEREKAAAKQQERRLKCVDCHSEHLAAMLK
jgi:hypothetical protein